MPVVHWAKEQAERKPRNIAGSRTDKDSRTHVTLESGDTPLATRAGGLPRPARGSSLVHWLKSLSAPPSLQSTSITSAARPLQHPDELVSQSQRALARECQVWLKISLYWLILVPPSTEGAFDVDALVWCTGCNLSMLRASLRTTAGLLCSLDHHS